jgi:hypothetical protein
MRLELELELELELNEKIDWQFQKLGWHRFH